MHQKITLAILLTQLLIPIKAMNTVLDVPTSSSSSRLAEQNDIYEALCRHLADPYAALFSAAKKGDERTVNLLLSVGGNLDINKPDDSGWTPLMIAANEGHTTIVKTLLAAGAQVGMTDCDGWTPLLVAAQNGHTKTVQKLLKACVREGVNIDEAQAKDGWTPLLFATRFGRKATVRALLESGANVHIANNNGRTPLFIASSCGHNDIVEILVAAGADLNGAENNGRTPLFVAAEHGHLETVKLLLNAGADCDLRTKEGWRFGYSVTLVNSKVDVDCIENSDSLHRLRPINCATEMYTQLKALKKKQQPNPQLQAQLKQYLKIILVLAQHDLRKRAVPSASSVSPMHSDETEAANSGSKRDIEAAHGHNPPEKQLKKDESEQ